MKLDAKEYPKRRRVLMDALSDNSIAILPAAPVTIRNRDVEHLYRQDSDFYYLSGFDEDNAVIVLIPGRAHGEYVVFCHDKDPAQEIWTGKRLGPNAAIKELGADDAFPIDDIDDILPGLLEGKDRIYANLGLTPEFDQKLMQWVKHIKAQSRLGKTAPHEFSALDPLLHEQRLIKSASEIKLMRQAATISAHAHANAMKASMRCRYEYELEAELMHTFMSAGSRWPAYASIVGSGDNACILHYTRNDQAIKSNSLVLIDAGCELDYYAADITRTFPARGRFSRAQKALYQVVLDAQLAAIDAVQPGNHWNQPHEAALSVLTQGLIDLGIIEGSLEDALQEERYKPFYMHKTGHWLGMDVHDVGDYRIDGQWRLLEPGMVLTIEPGLYMAPDNTDIDEQWRGIGIRIEDDVVVTRNGHDILTGDVPKTIDAIEALMASHSQ